MRHILFFLLSIGSASIFAEPIPPHVGEWSFTDYASYFRSPGNYINGGTSSTDLPFGGYFQSFEDTLSVNYDLLPALRLNANVSYGNTTASNPIVTFNNQGFTDGGVGAQYWFRQKRWALVPTVQAAFPFYRNSFTDNTTVITQTSSLLGDGTVWAEAGAWGMLYYHPVTIFGYLGYRYQDSGLAGLLTMDAGASYRFDTARVRLGIRGETEVTQDSDTSNPFYRNVYLATINNSSQKFFAVNPTVFEGYGEADWLFTRQLEAGLGFAQTFYGNNSAYGWTVEAMVRFRLPTMEAARESGPTHTEFGEPMPVGEPVFAPVGTENDEIAPKPKPRSRKKSNSVDQMIQDTERSLQN